MIPGAVELQPEANFSSDPDYWWTLRSRLDIAASWELDVLVRSYGAIDAIDVPSYTAVDATAGWNRFTARRPVAPGRQPHGFRSHRVVTGSRAGSVLVPQRTGHVLGTLGLHIACCAKLLSYLSMGR